VTVNSTVNQVKDTKETPTVPRPLVPLLSIPVALVALAVTPVEAQVTTFQQVTGHEFG
jgi:hypothetical protein